MSVALQLAQEADLSAIVTLMNRAFRGPATERSWSTENFITGSRTTESLLREEIAEGARILLTKDALTSALQGCVSLRALSPEKWYLGALTVDPAMQNAGFGRELLRSAEEYAAAHGARKIEITVVNLRQTLVAWYERRGYQLTGETRPFPYGDNRFGEPTRDDLEFVILTKSLAESVVREE